MSLSRYFACFAGSLLLALPVRTAESTTVTNITFRNHVQPVLAKFGTLTPSQRRIGKYFLLVGLVLLVQIAAGTIMAHSYYDRTSFYGIDINYWLPFNFLRDVHTQTPIVWIGVSWIGAALFLAPAIAGGQEAPGQRFLVDFLFWVTLLVVAGALIGNYLGIGNR